MFVSSDLMHNDIPDMNALLEESLAEEGPVDPSSKKMDSKYNSLVGAHKELKEGYDKLHRKMASGPGGSEFTEPRVEALWKMAIAANFSPDEISSLRVSQSLLSKFKLTLTTQPSLKFPLFQTELKHYEKRIEKLNHIQAEYILKSQYKDKTHGHTDKDTVSIFEDKIKRHERVVEKLHAEFEDRLGRRHSEL